MCNIRQTLMLCTLLSCIPLLPQAPISERKPEMRMVITKIVRVLLLKPVVPSPTISLLILHPHPNPESSTRQPAHPSQCETDAVARRISRPLGLEENVRGHDAACVAEADHLRAISTGQSSGRCLQRQSGMNAPSQS